MALWSSLMEILKRPTIGEILIELAMITVPLWVAVLVGVLVGWAWKPKWANFNKEFIDSSISKGFPKSAASSYLPSSNFLKFQLSGCFSWIGDSDNERNSSSSQIEFDANRSSSSSSENEKSNILNENDLRTLYKLVEEKDGGPAWIQMMDRSTPTMSYKAWRRDQESGPPQYRSRTVFEDANPEIVRDFFWDGEYRLKWDDMLIHASNLEDCSTTGTMVVQWIRKFPFFCSDREYIIGCRIWESDGTYYCVTKGVPCSSVPRRNKPRRVDLYYSSWRIRAVESNKGDGQLTACEVLLFHYEDMGIPWEIAKLGVRQGMWGAVKKFDPALRVYQKQRSAGAPLSRCAQMAQINTKVSPDYVRLLESDNSFSPEVDNQESGKKEGGNLQRVLVISGAVALACTLDRGLLTKAVIFGVARRFANIGGRRV